MSSQESVGTAPNTHARIRELRHKIREEGRQSLNPKEREEALILGITPKNISK